MQTLTAATLLLGLTLAPFGTFIYVYVGMTCAEPETLRIAKTAARAGCGSGYTGCVLAVIQGAGGRAALAAAVIAGIAATITFVTVLPPPIPPRPA